MKTCKIIIQFCAFLKDVPYGLALIKCNHPGDKIYSFEGVGVFTNGKLHLGPFIAIRGDDYVISCSQMIDGRPADSQFVTLFFASGVKAHLESLEEETYVGKMQSYSVQLQRGLWND